MTIKSNVLETSIKKKDDPNDDKMKTVIHEKGVDTVRSILNNVRRRKEKKQLSQ